MEVEPTDDLGLVLRAKREALGRSLREVADVTKLGVRTLDALERNQVDRLPPGIFRRSVVRAYSREIGLDPEATLLAFLERHPDDLPPPGRHTGPVADSTMRLSRTSDISPWVLVGLIVAVVVLLAVVVLQWTQRGAPSTVAPAHGRAPAVHARGTAVGRGA